MIDLNTNWQIKHNIKEIYRILLGPKYIQIFLSRIGAEINIMYGKEVCQVDDSIIKWKRK